MKAVIALSLLGLAIILGALLSLTGCSTGGHTVCYDGKCVTWTNTPPAGAGETLRP